MTVEAARARLIALIVACAMFMAQLDAAVVALALPAMARSFAVPPLQVTAGITIYLMAQIVLLPAAGWLADRYGARLVFITALAAFTLASVACAACRSLDTFLLARTLQGCAAALMAPVGRIVMLQTTAQEDLISVMNISTVPMLLAPSLGPALGGLITTYGSWRWIFLLNLPVGILGMVFALRSIPSTPAAIRRPFDARGFLLFAGSMTFLLYALQRLGDAFPHWLWPSALLCAGLILGALAIRHVRHRVHPIVSLAAIRVPSFSIVAVGGGSLVRLPIRSLPYLLPMMFQLALGMSALRAGALLLALNGGDLILKLVTTRTLRRFGFRTVLLAATLLSAASIAAFALFSAATPLAVLVTMLVVNGMFRSQLFSGMGTLVFADLPRGELASASIVWNIAQQFTNVLGVSLSVVLLAVSGQLAGEAPERPSVHDFHSALLVMAAIAALSLLSLRRLPRDAGAAVSGHRPAAGIDTRA